MSQPAGDTAGSSASGASSTTTDMSTLTGGTRNNSNAGRGGGGGRNGGRGGGGRGRGGRGGGRTPNNNNNPKPPTTTKFEGENEDLKGVVFDIGGTNPKDSILKCQENVERIARHMNTKHKSPLMQQETLTGVVQAVPVPTPIMVLDPTTNTEVPSQNPIHLQINNEKVKRYVIKEEELILARSQGHTTLWGQCSKATQDEAKKHAQHDVCLQNGSVAILILIIKTVMYQYAFANKHQAVVLIEVKAELNNCKQHDLSDGDHYDKFLKQTEVAKFNGASFGLDRGLVEKCLPQGVTFVTCDMAQLQAAFAAASEAHLAILFLKNMDMRRCGACWKGPASLQAELIKNNDVYPETMAEAHRMLCGFEAAKVTPKQDPKKQHQQQQQQQQQHSQRQRSQGPGTPGQHIAFTTVGDDGTQVSRSAVAGTDGRTYPDTLCYHCDKYGHIAPNCPNKQTDSGVQLLMHASADDFSNFNFSFLTCDVVLNQSRGGVIPWHWMLLDNQSTLCAIADRRPVTNIRAGPRPVTINSDAGVGTTNLIADLPGFPEPVWYNPNGIANIMSWNVMKKYFKVGCDTENDAFLVHKPDGTTRRFICSSGVNEGPNGLYFWDVREGMNKKMLASDKMNGQLASVNGKLPKDDDDADGGNKDTALVTTVADKKSNYAVKAYRMAEVARKLHNIIGCSLQDYLYYIDENLIKNCPITRQDVIAAEDVFGPNLRHLQGKTTRTASPTPATIITPIPPQIWNRYKNVTLCIDIMYVNKLPFFVTISQHIKFSTAEWSPNRQQDTVLQAAVRVKKLYAMRGFTVTHAFGDPEFECLKDDMANEQITLECVADDEHVGEIERGIRTHKERIRSLWSGLPFRKHVPVRATIEFVLGCITWLNMFPPTGGISKTISPRMLITGAQIDFDTHCKLEPGDYVQTHEEHDNTVETLRTTGAIMLRPAGINMGGYFFLSLTSGRKIHRKRFTPMPTPNEVIERVYTLARRSKAARGLTFAWRDGTEITDDNDDDDDDSDYNPDDDDDASYCGIIPGVDDNENTDNMIDNDTDTENNDTDTENNNNDDSDTQSEGEGNNEADDSEGDDIVDSNTGDDQTQSNEENGDSEGTDNEETEQTEQIEERELDNEHQTGNQAGNTNGEEVADDPQADEEVADDPQTLENANPTIGDQNLEPQIDELDIATETDDGENTGVHGARSGEITGVNDDNYYSALADDDDDSRHSAGVADPAGTTRIDQMDDKYGRRLLGSLRPRKQRDYYKHKFGPMQPGYINAQTTTRNIEKPRDFLCQEPGYEPLEQVVLTQYTAQKGLEIFKEAGAEAILKEMKQLDMRDVLQPLRWDMMTREEKKSALEHLMFLKKKRCGRIKGRGCADGRKQRSYKSKHESSSPTAAIESLFLSCMIDAKEKRCVATVDIPGAFMQAPMGETVFVRLTGACALLLAKVDPKKYEKFIHYEKGKPVLCAKLKKALCGASQAALLFWKDLTANLDDWGFKLNPHDSCVANAEINGSQCTILWHVDDLKISHKDPAVVHDIIDKLNDKYGQEAPLTETTGLVHDYLGMTIDHSAEGKVIFRMDDYVKEILDEAGEDGPMKGEAVDPAADHLFAVNNDNPTKLDKDKADFFHRIVAKLLHISKRARPDVQEPAAFLTTRVKSPDEDDYKKLGRVIRCLRTFPDLPLTLEADDTHVIKWWVDASYAAHQDMKSHTGATMSMGKGCPYSASTRQKLNTISSTEAELVAAADVMPVILWTRYFLEAQGYEVKDNTVYQDGKSAILLEKNGRASSSKRTKHINVRYFFVKDRIQSKEISVEYCPTDDMVGDFFTKPLSGSKFRKFRRIILNLPDDFDDQAATARSQECVEGALKAKMD